ncbi:MAG: hypothetical protein AAGI52_10985 [Bacteroidota bacterium]
MVSFWLLLGLISAAVFVRIGRGRPLAWWAVSLVVVAAVYVGFALARGDVSDALIEAGGAVVYGAVAWLGLRRDDARIVAAGWALHPLWDLGAHIGAGLEAPAWYVWACLSFDLVVAVVLLTRPGWSRSHHDDV